jgi:glutaminyl-peptide cyclotransferase
MNRTRTLWRTVALASLAAALVACGGGNSTRANSSEPPASALPPAAPQASSLPPAADPGVDGFSGKRAYDYVAKQVAFGPRPPGSDAIHQLQAYLLDQLNGFGCKVDVDDFHANTPEGSIAMKNITAKIPGSSPNVILLATHYDTDTIDPHDQKMTNFVGADDGGSSTGLMLEMARVLCGKPQPATIWIVFFDGEEALQHWSDTDGTYGSREMAAKLALSGQLAHVKALVLADLVGSKDLRLRREDNSVTSGAWLTDMIWATAAKLGYQSVFLSAHAAFEDDHLPFVARKVPSADIIRCCSDEIPYWHTPQDAMDKIGAQSLQIVGDVILTSLPEIARHIR